MDDNNEISVESLIHDVTSLTPGVRPELLKESYRHVSTQLDNPACPCYWSQESQTHNLFEIPSHPYPCLSTYSPAYREMESEGVSNELLSEDLWPFTDVPPRAGLTWKEAPSPGKSVPPSPASYMTTKVAARWPIGSVCPPVSIRREPVDPPRRGETAERTTEGTEPPIPSPAANTAAPPQKKKSKKRPRNDSGVAETRKAVPEGTVVVQLSDETESSREAKKRRTDESRSLEAEENDSVDPGKEGDVDNVEPPSAKDLSPESEVRGSVPEDAILEEPASVPTDEEPDVVLSSDSSSSQQGDVTAEDDDGDTVEESGEKEGGSPRRGVSEEPPKDSGGASQILLT
ncbi:hypothetical protein Bca101_058494 [Brassica carinata]